MTPDKLIARVNEWLRRSKTSVKTAAVNAGIAENTAHLILKGRGGQIKTLSRLCALVPADFQK